MKVFELDIDTYENAEILNTLGTEANIYASGDKIFKILQSNYRDKLREKCVDEMTELSHPNIVFPEEKLVWFDNKEFIGVTAEYLKTYITLSKYLNNNHLDFKLRQQMAYKMCEIIDYLNSIGLKYIDIHASNVMTNGSDLKLIDVDSAEFSKYHAKSEYFTYMRNDIICTSLSSLCISILMNTDAFTKYIPNEQISDLLKMCNKRQKEFMRKAFDRKKELICVGEYIDCIDEGFTEDVRRSLHL